MNANQKRGTNWRQIQFLVIPDKCRLAKMSVPRLFRFFEPPPGPEGDTLFENWTKEVVGVDD
jgi:hypothetical protein